MDSHDKTKSKFQIKVNRLQRLIAEIRRALEKRKQYTRNADAFIRKLLKEGRTTKEELSEYFKPIKPAK